MSNNRPVMVSLKEEQITWLNEHNQRKSNLIRMLLDEYIKTHSSPSKVMDDMDSMDDMDGKKTLFGERERDGRKLGK